MQLVNERTYVPAIGGPAADDNPRTNDNNPTAFVNFVIPKYLMRNIVDSGTKAAGNEQKYSDLILCTIYKSTVVW